MRSIAAGTAGVIDSVHRICESVGPRGRVKTALRAAWALRQSSLRTALILSLLVPFSASEAAAAITFVKNIGVNASAASGTSIAVTVPSAIPVGNEVVLTVAFTAASGTVSVSDTSHGTYAVAADVTNASNVRTVILAVRVTSAYSAGQTISVTTPTATRRALSANEFSGLSTTPLDRTQTGTGNTASPSSGLTAATTQNTELLLGAIGVNGQASDTFTATGTLTNALAAVQAVIAFTDSNDDNAGSSVTSIPLSTPGNTLLNDVMIASITARSPNTTQPTISTPSGWTAVPNCNTQDTTNRITTASFYRVATAADVTGTSYTWNLGGPSSARMVGGIVSYSGVDTVNPIDASNSASATNVAPSLTATLPGSLLVGIWSHINEINVTQPAGMTERYDQIGGSSSPTVGTEVADQVVTAGATGTRTATASSTPTIAQSIVLRPSGTAITIDPTYQVVTTTGTYSATGTLSATRQWAAAIATFKAASVCGDSVVDGTEACDLGGANGSTSSCCTATCTFRAGGLQCRAGGVCDPAETCTGSSGTCPADVLSASGTACGSGTDTDCTNPDTCNGMGTCLVNDETAGTSCGDPSDTECTDPDSCNGSGTCLANNASAGASCGDPSDTECTNPDTCNGSGACAANNASAGVSCGDPSDTECTNPDTCNGSGTCDVNDASAGASCGDPSDTDCTNPDTCNGSGTCQVNDASAGSSCGDPSDTDCTNPDTCNGSGACQVNDASAGTSCGDSSDTECTDPDTCNGSGACLANNATPGISCGDPSDTDCTNPDTCSVSGTCQANDATTGTACGDGSDTECTNPDTCDGSGTCEVNDASAGSSCGDPSDTECTDPDTCNGSGTCQVNDASAGAACGDPSDTDCTNPDTCNGSGACEVNDASAGAACGAVSYTHLTLPTILRV